MYLSLAYHEIFHFLLSIIVGLIVWRLIPDKKKSHNFILPSFVGAFLGEFFLDIDHLVDYFFVYGFHFRFDYFLLGYQFEKLHKTFVPFHSWELVIGLTVLSFFIQNKPFKYFLAAVSLGIFFHLTYDIVYNHFYILGYSFVYRFLHNFDLLYIVIPDK